MRKNGECVKETECDEYIKLQSIYEDWPLGDEPKEIDPDDNSENMENTEEKSVGELDKGNSKCCLQYLIKWKVLLFYCLVLLDTEDLSEMVETTPPAKATENKKPTKEEKEENKTTKTTTGKTDVKN